MYSKDIYTAHIDGMLREAADRRLAREARREHHRPWKRGRSPVARDSR